MNGGGARRRLHHFPAGSRPSRFTALRFLTTFAGKIAILQALTRWKPKVTACLKLAIIGGGPGGLFAAWHLESKVGTAFDITIYEASERLGGKIVTNTFAGVGHYEAGVAEIYDYSSIGPDPLRNLIEGDLGLKILHISGGACVLDNTVIADVDALAGVFSSAARDAARDFRTKCKTRMTRAAYYKSSPTADNAHPWSGVPAGELLAREVPDADARRYLRVMTHSDISAPLHQTDGLNLMKNVLMDVPGYIDVYSVTGGNEEIVHRLNDELDANVVTGAAVRRVSAKPAGGFTLSFAQGSGRADVEADLVILALPMIALSLVEFSPPALAGTMARHVGHFDRPGHYLRVTILFERPFWRSHIDGAWWMLDAFGGCCVYDEGARHDFGAMGALGFLIAGNGATEFGNLSDDKLIDLCLQSLPPQFGDARALYVEGKVHRWMGSVNALPGGRPARNLAQNHQPEPETTRGLFLVGDYLFDSTLNGVLDSADAATDALVSQFMRYGLATAAADGQLPERANFIEPAFVHGLARSIWELGPGLRILHVGSGAGELVAGLRALGADAYGIESDAAHWAHTPDALRNYNVNGDFASMPFANGRFDVVFEMALYRQSAEQTAPLIREIGRLACHGLIVGSATTDLPMEMIERYGLLASAAQIASRGELAERLFEARFDLTLVENDNLDAAWSQVLQSPGAKIWYEDVESLVYSVFDAPAPAAPAQLPRPAEVSASATNTAPPLRPVRQLARQE